VAIVQISRITNRKGLTENLPQLAGAELGWCIDSRRLFIGNGTLEEGAPVIGNTEILTQFSDIAALAEYTYTDSVVGYAAQTGATASTPVVRTVSAKLDDFASIRDFGAAGDGVTDDTNAINRALYQLYCREPNNTQTRRSLYFPAGTYIVTETIAIPTWAKLVGEGADCTFITLTDPFDSGLVDYVAQYADSLQQTGANLGSNGATLPRNIEISSITFQNLLDSSSSVFLVAQATQCWFESVNFRGSLGTAPTTAADNLIGTEFSGVCEQITFDRCRWQGLTYGINTAQPIASVTVSNSAFYDLYQGIVLANPTAVSGGPTGFRAVGNFFDNIYAQGVIYGQASLCATAYNIFYDAGNALGGTPVTPVIQFANDVCASISDMFERTDSENNQVARVSVSTTTPAADAPGTELQLGRYARLNGLTANIPDNSSGTTVATTNPNLVRAFSMDYTMVRESNVRHGLFTVTSAGAGTAVFTDDYVETTNIGVVLAASQTGANSLVVTANSTSTGDSVSLTYSISHLA
jgi:hypothetical protein